MLSLIVAMSENRVIGRSGDMPWRLSSDLRRFKKITMGHKMVMGRKTFDSIGRLLPGRITVIVTRQEDYQVEGAVVVASLEDFISQQPKDEELFIVGGGQIYKQALPLAEKIYLTKIQTQIDDGDTFFPEVDWENCNLIEEEQITADEKTITRRPFKFGREKTSDF